MKKIRATAIMQMFLMVTTISISWAETTFKDALVLIGNSSKLSAIRHESESIKFNGLSSSSWSDPMLKIDATNFPEENPRFGFSPMSGIGITLSQKIPITPRLGRIEESFENKALASDYGLEIEKRKLVMKLWSLLSELNKAGSEQSILNDNIDWISEILKSSSVKYSTGKVKQEAVIDLRVRKKTLQSRSMNLKYEIARLWDETAYLLESENIVINQRSVPWNWLDSKSKDGRGTTNPEEARLEKNIQSLDSSISAVRWSYVPDLTIGINYRYREPTSMDSGDNFIGAYVSFPIPLFGGRLDKLDSLHRKLLSEESRLNGYKKTIGRLIDSIKNNISQFEAEYYMLEEGILELARYHKRITAKNYKLSLTGYTELLKSQIQLQNMEIRRIHLRNNIRKLKIRLLYEKGLPLTPYNERRD